jgi:hypothetical protein
MRLSRMSIVAAVALAEGGCGLGVSQLPEVWDRTDSTATAKMEIEIKKAIFCELRKAVFQEQDKQVRMKQETYVLVYKKSPKNKKAPKPEKSDDTLVFRITLTLTADEKSSVLPNVSFKDPISPATVFRQNVNQSFALGVGGTFSSQNVRYDKYTFEFGAAELTHEKNSKYCPPENPSSSSSPFVDGTKLGISDWLPGAVEVFKSEPPSKQDKSVRFLTLTEEDKARFLAPRNYKARLLADGDGGGGAFKPNVATYDNKFVIVSSANLAATWNLVRIGTGTSPLLDLNRTRTHELLITVNVGALETHLNGDRWFVVQSAPSDAAKNSHFASEIGSAVAAAIGNR